MSAPVDREGPVQGDIVLIPLGKRRKRRRLESSSSYSSSSQSSLGNHSNQGRSFLTASDIEEEPECEDLSSTDDVSKGADRNPEEKDLGSSNSNDCESDDEVRIIMERFVDKTKVLESVPNKEYRNPLYSGSTSPASSVGSRQSPFSMENHVLEKSLTGPFLIKRCDVRIRKCKVTVRVDIYLPFKVGCKTSRAKISLPEPGAQLREVRIFSAQGYFEPVRALEDSPCLYFSAEANGRVYSRVGPIKSYSKRYNRNTHSLEYLDLCTSRSSYQVHVDHFNKEYKTFLSHGVRVNPELCPSSLPRSKPSHKIPVLKSKEVKHLSLPYLQIENLDTKELVRRIPALRSYSSKAKTLRMIAGFLRFCEGRQKRWRLKRLGLEDPATDPIFIEKKFTNLARELDRGTQYLREQLLPLLKETKTRTDALPTVLFKSAIYRLLNKVETFLNYGGIPDVKDLKSFLKFISAQMASNTVVFTSVHQNMGAERYCATVTEVQKTLEELRKRLSQCKSLKSAFDTLKGIKNVGNFFAWQILCDLTESRVLTVRDEDEWAALGPGALKGLKYVFGSAKHPVDLTRSLTKIVQQGSTTGWMDLHLPSPLKINCKLVEHALCEFSKYCRFSESGESGRPFPSRSSLDDTRECIECKEQGEGTPRFFCIMCNRMEHKGCLNNQVEQLSFCCQDCSAL